MSRRLARLDLIGLTLSAAAASAFLGAVAYVNVLRGLSSGDDGFFAVAAKTVAAGAGYAMPRSSDVLVPFDYLISTGPTMIVPLALAIDAVGLHDRLPGAVALAMFAALMAAAVAIVARRVSVAAAAAFAAMLLVLVVVGTRETRLFGVFVGEAVAFGLVVVAVLVLAHEEGRAPTFVGGVCLALAVLTKLLAGFPIVGVAIAYLALEVHRRGRTAAALERPLLLALGVAALIVPFEAAHIAAVGPDGYVQSWIDTTRYSGALGTRADSLLALPGLVLATIDFAYIDAAVLAVAGVGVAAPLVWRRGRARAATDPHDVDRIPERPVFVRRALALSAGALLVQWAYLLARSTVYDRYLFIGVGLIFLTLSLLVLLVPVGRRMLPVAAVVVAALVADPAVLALRADAVGADKLHAERLAVIAALDAAPTVPYAGDYWPTLYQFVAIRSEAGEWAYGRDAAAFAGRPIIAVEDVLLSARDAEFVSAARAECTLLTPAGTRLRAYACDEPFWREYLDTRAFSAAPSPGIDPEQVTRGGACNVDYFGRDAPRRTAVTVDRQMGVPVFGWAWDDARRLPPEAVALALTDTSGTQRWFAPAQPEARADLGNHFGLPGSTGFGFKVAASFAEVPVGSYRLSALVVVDGRVLDCDTRLVVSVT